MQWTACCRLLAEQEMQTLRVCMCVWTCVGVSGRRLPVLRLRLALNGRPRVWQMEFDGALLAENRGARAVWRDWDQGRATPLVVCSMPASREKAISRAGAASCACNLEPMSSPAALLLVYCARTMTTSQQGGARPDRQLVDRNGQRPATWAHGFTVPYITCARLVAQP